MRIDKEVNGMFAYASTNVASSSEAAAKGKSGKAVVNAANLNIPKSSVELRREEARKKASLIVKNAFANEKSTDDKIKQLEDQISELSDGIVKDRKTIKENEGLIAESKAQAGVEDDSKEQQDLEFLIAMDIKKESKNPFDIITDEEQARIDEIEAAGLTEYQSLARELSEHNRVLTEKIDDDSLKSNVIAEGIKDIRLERLKSSPIGEARDQAEDIIDAANQEIIGMLRQEAMDHIDEVAEEEKAKAKEKAEKEEELEEKVEEAKARRKENEARTEEAKEKRKAQEELLEEAMDLTTTMTGTMTDLDNVQSQVKSQLDRVISKANLLPEDLKGTQVDTVK